MRRLALLAACASLWGLLAVSSAGAQTATVPGPPTNLSATAATGSLTITWNAPGNDGGAPITAYDLRYGRGSAGQSVSDWMELEVSNVAALETTVTGLIGEISYGVEVRAVNSAGDGQWSDTLYQVTADHGNTTATATPLALGDDLSGTIDPPADEDYFSFTISTRTDVWFYTTGDTDTHGHLYNSSGTQLAESNDSGNPDYHQAFELRAFLNPGTYYVGIQTFEQASSGPYTLHARVAAPAGDSRGEATLVTPTAEGTLVPGRIARSGHENYFKFVLTSSADVFITTSGRTTTADPFTGEPVTRELDARINVYGENSDLVDGNDDSSFPVDNRRPLIRERLSAGTYYVVVDIISTASVGTGAYSLFVQLVPDHGTSVPDATEIPLSSTSAGNIGSFGVGHFFKFTLEHPVWVRLTAGSNNDGLSLSWELFDSPSLTSDIGDSLYDRGTSHERIAFSPKGLPVPRDVLLPGHI